MVADRLVPIAIFFSLTGFGAGTACGQPYPSKPIRIITGAPGGGNDFAARMVAQGISGPLGQTVIVDNRGSSILTAPVVAKSAPDGYTLLVGANVMWLEPMLSGAQPALLEEFSPISTLVSSPNAFVVHASLPVKSVKELIAFAKARPRALNYAASTIGSSSHISGEMLNTMAGIKIVAIPYKGAVASLNAVLSGQVEMGFLSPVGLEPHVKSGRLRTLAVTSLQPSALAPGVPTMAAGGLPGYEITQIAILYAPAKTPAAIVNQLHQEVTRFLARADTKEKFLSTGVEVVGNTPEQAAATIKSAIVSMSKVIKDAGIKVD
jgi:tripartite-type tricarboxylate transporter receptor subunit TctC